MNATKNFLTNLCNLLVCACEAFRYGLTFLRAILCSRAVLAAKLLAVESQLAACKQRIASNKRPRPRFTASFRLLWVVLSKSLDKWEDLVHLMQPATVKKWHTTTFRYFWRWKSRRKGGRPPISKEMQGLIYKLSKENPLTSLSRDFGSKVIGSKRSPAMNLRPRLHRSGKALFVRPMLPGGLKNRKSQVVDVIRQIPPLQVDRGIFISYAKEDRTKAKKLAAVFEAQGYSVWWDRKISLGETQQSYYHSPSCWKYCHSSQALLSS